MLGSVYSGRERGEAVLFSTMLSSTPVPWSRTCWEEERKCVQDGLSFPMLALLILAIPALSSLLWDFLWVNNHRKIQEPVSS